MISLKHLLANNSKKQTDIQTSIGAGEEKTTIFLCEHMVIRVKEYLDRTNRFIDFEWFITQKKNRINLIQNDFWFWKAGNIIGKMTVYR